MAQHADFADHSEPSSLHDKVNDWRQRCALPGAPEDDGLSSYSDPFCFASKPAMVRRNDRVWVRKDHRDPHGNTPLCYVETGYQGPRGSDGEYHDAYLCYNVEDIKWARRLKFHLERLY